MLIVLLKLPVRAPSGRQRSKSRPASQIVASGTVQLAVEALFARQQTNETQRVHIKRVFSPQLDGVQALNSFLEA